MTDILRSLLGMGLLHREEGHDRVLGARLRGARQRDKRAHHVLAKAGVLLARWAR